MYLRSVMWSRNKISLNMPSEMHFREFLKSTFPETEKLGNLFQLPGSPKSEYNIFSLDIKSILLVFCVASSKPSLYSILNDLWWEQSLQSNCFRTNKPKYSSWAYLSKWFRLLMLLRTILHLKYMFKMASFKIYINEPLWADGNDDSDDDDDGDDKDSDEVEGG